MALTRFILMLALLGGCVAVLPPDHPPVPPLRAEPVPAPPRSPATLIWRPGHWVWTGAEYVWAPGEWVQRTARTVLWQDGFWRQVNGQSQWVPAHWI